MLDLYITHYKEPWEVCRKQFQMLDLQRLINWDEIRVTVVNDGGHRLPAEKLGEMSFPVHQLDIPHGGISAARNAGIENGKEPWIMWCDCDDCFANIYALRDVMNILHRKDALEQFDMMWCSCCEEDNIDGYRILRMIERQKIFVFCHGKIYRREFLIWEGIRFDTGLTFNEDSCFNAVVIARTPHTRIGEIKSHAPIYTWIRRSQSVTTGANAPDDGAYGQMKRNMKVTEENRLHRSRDNYCGMVTRTAYDAFYIIHGKRVSAQGKRRIAEAFVPWMKEHRTDFGEVEPEILEQIRTVSKSELIGPDERIPDSHETVRDWVDMITEVVA